MGCGQFSFANIAYFLKKNHGNIIYGAYDIDSSQSDSFAKYYKCKTFNDPKKLLSDPNVKYVYIASNHASHTEYAVKAFSYDKIVYIEKPLSVNRIQLDELSRSVNKGKFYAGFNRPFSPAIKEISKYLKIKNIRKPLSLNCFIVGHKIPQDDWYRNKKEGSRINGNLTHWIDLTINLLSKIGLPNRLNISIITSSVTEKDDNLILNITSDYGDLISIMLTSREEPFEGVSEMINLQYSNIIAKIDDFRKLTIWNKEKIIKKKYFHKDVGHRNSIMEPFEKKLNRSYSEIELSTKLGIEINEYMSINQSSFTFEINEPLESSIDSELFKFINSLETNKEYVNLNN